MAEDLDIAQPIEDEAGFWEKLHGILSSPCASHEVIDDSLRAWLYLVAGCRDRFLDSEDDVASCSQSLIDSAIFQDNQEYVRTQIVYSFLQEDDCSVLHAIANFLLLDGRTDETTFRLMVDKGCFVRLLDLLRGCREHDRRLHRLLVELMYQISRIERLQADDLAQVDDALVLYLFQLIEALSDDTDDPYHYSIIRVLLVLNEQYMVASTATAVDPRSPSPPLTNRVIKILGVHGPKFRTFGENLILLLNRESEMSLQLLILKLLYLLFTTKATYEYFYTNDLRVLLDVIIRNLLDLPVEVMSLRHTYLRVLYPLLGHTQLSHSPHYKRDEILRVLRILSGNGSGHFAPADETTMRLVERVSKVRWLGEEADGEAEVARKFLGISLSQSQTASSVSVGDIANVTEKPGVQTPSRKAEFEEFVLETTRDPRPKPETRSHGDPSPPSVSGGVARPSETLPEVPRHRHGAPISTNPTGTVAETGQKKLPPKLPPPRRQTRIKPTPASGAESLGTTEALATLPGSTSVS